MALKQKTVEVNGQEYTLQKIPTEAWYQLKDRCATKNGSSEAKLYKEICEHIIVNPKVKMNDFEEVEDFEALMKEAVAFQCIKGNQE